MIAENGVTTEFVTFNGLVLAGYDKDGERTAHYLYGNRLLAEESGNETVHSYYLQNSHGDVVGLTDKQGSLSSAYAYDSFGNLIATENNHVELTDTLSNFLYSGEQYDAISGLYYLRARHYDTVAGRFTQEDAYLGDGRNLYSYVHNNPLKYTDPSGHGGVDILDDGSSTNDLFADRESGFGGSNYNYAVSGGSVAVAQPSGGSMTAALQGAGTVVVGSFLIAGATDKVSDVVLDIEVLMQRQGKTKDKAEEAEERVGVVIGDTDAADRIMSNEEEVGGTGDGGCGGDSGEEPDNDDPHIIGEKGTQTTSTTTGKNGPTERVDVENPAPGRRPGNVHYHESDNTKWYYDLNEKMLVDQIVDKIAPPRVQKVMDTNWFRKALEKALKILGESLK